MSFLRSLLASLPDAAKSDRALVAYAIAALVWLIIGLRVFRNRNVLKSLEKLPKRDRLAALQMEMGAVPIREGVSAEQFLKARIHAYYFWGFIAVCMVVVLLFGIASFDRYHGKPSEGTRPDVDQQRQTRITNIEKNIALLDIGVDKNFVFERFGTPHRRDSTRHFERFFWEDEFFLLIAEFGNEGLDGFVFETLSPDLKPPIPFLVSVSKDDGEEVKRPRLGAATFAELDMTAPIKQPRDAKTVDYVEAVRWNGSHAMHYHFGYLDTDDNSRVPHSIFSQFETEVESGNFGHATEQARKLLSPNAMSLFRDDLDTPRDSDDCKGERCGWISVWRVHPFDPLFSR
jgi:hypothetical protein